MLRSVKSQIIVAVSLIILLILSTTAYFVIDQKVREINHDILTKAVSFAELTHERVITNYENRYTQKAFAHFEREMAEIYSLNEDISGVEIFNYNADVLYSESGKNIGIGQRRLDRIQAVFPSVQIKKSGRVVYLEKEGENVHFTDLNGQKVAPIADTEQLADVIYPFRDQNDISRAFSIRYSVSYDALAKRIQETVMRIMIIAIAGLIIALLIGGVVAGRITSPIKALTQGAEKIGKGDLKTRVQVTSKTEVGKLAGTFNQMAADLEKSTQELVEKEKITHELEIAGEIQQELLPQTLPTPKELDIAASLKSADQVGGDCYDFLPFGKDRLLFYIADVTGHGVPAGLVSAINNALVPALIKHCPTTKDLITELNAILKQKTRANVFMTMVMALWEKSSSTLHFTQAGHDPILHFKSSKKSVNELAFGGMALGMIPDVNKVTKADKIKVDKGDILVFYTDGIPEAWKNEKENYGMERFKASVEKHSKLKTAQQIHDALLKDVHAFMGKYPQQDDMTLIVVKKN